MSSEMVERVARAMWKSQCPNTPWDAALDEDYYDGPGRTTLRSMARAAIEAMREPNEAMLRAGDDLYMAGVNVINGVPELGDEASFQLYRAMIDAALTLEGTEP